MLSLIIIAQQVINHFACPLAIAEAGMSDCLIAIEVFFNEVVVEVIVNPV
jgi:hypothetical protein